VCEANFHSKISFFVSFRNISSCKNRQDLAPNDTQSKQQQEQKQGILKHRTFIVIKQQSEKACHHKASIVI
jgi:hypothetical protein